MAGLPFACHVCGGSSEEDLRLEASTTTRTTASWPD